MTAAHLRGVRLKMFYGVLTLLFPWVQNMFREGLTVGYGEEGVVSWGCSANAGVRALIFRCRCRRCVIVDIIALIVNGIYVRSHFGSIRF